MKKSLILWLAAITCAAWILVGCESPTDGTAGAAGKPGPATLPEDATPAMLAALFETTDTVIVGLPLGEGTFTVPAGKTLAVAGTVDIKSVDTVINAFNGTLNVSAGGFTADGDNVFIVAEAAVAAVKAAAPGGIVPAYAASIPSDPTAITGDVVLPSLSIGGSGTSAADFGTFAGTTYKVFVMGNVTIDATTTPFNTGSANLVALGETTAAGAGGVTFGATTVIGTLKATNALTITAVGAGKVKKLDLNGQTVTITAVANITEITNAATAGGTIALGSGTGLPKVTVGASDIAVTTTGVSLTVDDLSTGAGKLVLPAAAISFAATAGGGNFSYAAAPASLTLSSTTGLTYVGNLSVAGAVSVSSGDLTVGGNAAFTGALTGPTSSPATITFNGATASIGSYTTKAAASADTFAGSAALTITALTDTSDGASKVVFNGTGLAKIMNNFTVNTGGLTIAGTGFVDVESGSNAPAVATVGLSIANTGGVHFDKLVVGSSSNTVTLTKAVFSAGSAAAPILLTTASGTGVTLGTGDVLALANTGTIAVASSGEIAIGTHGEISGVGTWTATAGTNEYVAITSLANMAFIGASKRDGSTADTAGTLAATAGTAGDIKVVAQKTLVLGAKTTINVGGTTTRVGAIVLAKTDGTAPANLVFGGTGAQIITGVAAEGTVLTGANGAFVAVGGNTQDKGHVSAFAGGNHLVITADSTNAYLASIVYGAGAPYITGPENSGGGDFTISVAIDPVT